MVREMSRNQVWLLIACRLQTLAFTGLYDYRTG